MISVSASGRGLILGGSLFALLGIASPSIALESRWRSDPRPLPNELDFFRGAETESASNVDFAVMNDANHLWVYLAPDDFRGAAGFAHGVTLWFGSEDEKELGFRLVGDPPPRGPASGSPPDPAEMKERFTDAWKKVEVVNADGDVSDELSFSDDGVAYFVDVDDAPKWVLRIPLQSDAGSALALLADGNESIGFGFETAAFEPPKDGRRGGPPSGRSGDRGGFGGRGGGGRGQGPPGGNGSRGPREPVDVWTKLQLASPIDDAGRAPDNPTP